MQLTQESLHKFGLTSTLALKANSSTSQEDIAVMGWVRLHCATMKPPTLTSPPEVERKSALVAQLASVTASTSVRASGCATVK